MKNIFVKTSCLQNMVVNCQCKFISLEVLHRYYITQNRCENNCDFNLSGLVTLNLDLCTYLPVPALNKEIWA